MPEISLVIVEPVEPINLSVAQAQVINLTISNVAFYADHIHTYVHDQQVPAKVWNVTHNLGKFPSVNIVDTGNSIVIGEVDYVDINHLTLTFTSSFSGKAYIN